jgi:hypothetical protein
MATSPQGSSPSRTIGDSFHVDIMCAAPGPAAQQAAEHGGGELNEFLTVLWRGSMDRPHGLTKLWDGGGGRNRCFVPLLRLLAQRDAGGRRLAERQYGEREGGLANKAVVDGRI